MCEVKKYGLIHDSFLVSIAREVSRVPKNFDAGFFLHFKIRHSTLKFWFPKLSRMVVSGDQLFLYSNDREHEDQVLCFDSEDIDAFKIEYDDLLAEYNGECIDERTKNMFKLSVWEKNKSSKYS